MNPITPKVSSGGDAAGVERILDVGFGDPDGEGNQVGFCIASRLHPT